MTPTRRRFSKEEIARHGDAIYQADVLPRLTAEDADKFAAIDVDSGNFELASDELAACDRLSARIPEPQIWLVKVGTRYLHRFAGRAGYQTRFAGVLHAAARHRLDR
jgi:hypothetical protein